MQKSGLAAVASVTLALLGAASAEARTTVIYAARVITDADNHVKKIIFHPAMLPRIAILDPELTEGLPPSMAAGTGMDALSHAIEAFCAPSYHPMADAIAMEAVRLVKDYLPRAVRVGTAPGSFEPRRRWARKGCPG